MNHSIQSIAGTPINPEQSSYLNGFFKGLSEQGFRFNDVSPDPAISNSEENPELDDLCKEEQLKHKVDLNKTYHLLHSITETGKSPDAEETFLLKWHGLFYLNHKQDGFMCRLRIPGGFVKAFQMRELASISREITSGYIQITTRANFQLRVIPIENATELMRRIQSVGLHSKGAGADNIRNITASPCAGYDPDELINVKPLCLDLAQSIINTDEFYNLPRKFNIAYDGGGKIGVVEDTNDIGVKAVELKESIGDVSPGVYFLIALGGVTGHKTFATDAGILVPVEKVNETILAMTRVFIENGDRTSRKKARLKYLLKDWGIPKFLDQVDDKLGESLTRLNSEDLTRIQNWNPPKAPVQSHAHLGVFEQKQPGLHYVGVGIPTGVLTPDQLDGIANLCEQYGNGEARLTVWQNLIIPNVPTDSIQSLLNGILDLGLYVEPGSIRSGVIACTGNSFCKFASSNTKGHAKILMEYLEEHCKLDTPINIHITGCPHSCAQHYIGDIGLLATQVKTETEPVEGYHVFVGGGFGEQRDIGRQIAKSVVFEDLQKMLLNLIVAYQNTHWPQESFQSFTQRYSSEDLCHMMNSKEWETSNDLS